jgi:hypothetical protein
MMNSIGRVLAGRQAGRQAGRLALVVRESRDPLLAVPFAQSRASGLAPGGSFRMPKEAR